VILLAALSAGLAAYLAAGAAIGAMPSFRRLGAHRSGGDRRLWLEQAGLTVSPLVFATASVGGGLVVLALLTAVSGTVRISLPPAVGAVLLPTWFFGRRRSVRLGEVQAAWPDGIRHILAGVRSGLTLAHAIEDMIETGPPPLAVAFQRFPTLAGTFGFGPALEVVRDEIADPTTDRVVEVLLVAHDSGGRLTMEILGDLAESTTADLRATEEIRTNALEQQLNARIVFVIPWLVLVLLTAADGSFREFYRSQSAGLIVIVIGGVLSAVGTLLLRRLARDEIEQRVFGGDVT
jgi:tight adherence protein B